MPRQQRCFDTAILGLDCLPISSEKVSALPKVFRCLFSRNSRFQLRRCPFSLRNPSVPLIEGCEFANYDSPLDNAPDTKNAPFKTLLKRERLSFAITRGSFFNRRKERSCVTKENSSPLFVVVLLQLKPNDINHLGCQAG